jgi:UDP-N-acetylglucosamine 1-carboxyvinyltransferase
MNMDKFVIEGGIPLNGEVTPAGNKNAALPLLAAALLTEEPIVLRNIPQIQDSVMRKLIESLACRSMNWMLPMAGHGAEPAADLNPDLAAAYAPSILVAEPLAARIGEFKLPPRET